MRRPSACGRAPRPHRRLYLDHFEVSRGLCIVNTRDVMLLNLDSKVLWRVAWRDVVRIEQQSQRKQIELVRQYSGKRLAKAAALFRKRKALTLDYAETQGAAAIPEAEWAQRGAELKARLDTAKSLAFLHGQAE